MARDDIGSWTIVIDDVEDLNFSVEPQNRPLEPQPGSENAFARFFPECSHGSLIFLTQSQSISNELSDGHAAALVEVTPLSADESVRMMETCLGHIEEPSQLTKLIHLLGHSPLAMKQAASCICCGDVGLREYTTKLEAELEASLASEIVPPGSTSHDGKADLQYNAWIAALAISRQQLTQDDAETLQLLSLATFYDSHAIPISVFEMFLEDARAVARLLRILESYSLIEYNIGNDFIDMHRLVRSIARGWLIEDVEDQEWILHASKSLLCSFPTRALLDLDFCAQVLPHTISILEHSTIADDVTRSTLLSLAGLCFRSQGQWGNAIQMELDALEMRGRLSGAAKDPLRLTSMDYLAFLYANTGRWAEAMELQKRLVHESERVLGPKHHDMLNRLAGLAKMYTKLGRWVEAQEVEENVLQSYLEIYGSEHPRTLTSMANLARTYSRLGDLERAENLAVRGTETIKKVLGLRHPDTLHSMAALTSILEIQGKFTEAEELGASILATSKEVLGPEDPDTLNRMSNLALIRQSLGQWAEAEKLERQVLDAHLTIFGDDHPDSLTSMNNLAVSIMYQGRFDEAEKLQTLVIKKRLQVQGAEHPDTLSSMGSLASIYREQGRLKDAEELGTQVMERSVRILGAEHRNTLKNMHRLALIYQKQGRHNEATALMKSVVESRSKTIGPDHPDTLESIRVLESLSSS